MYQEYLNQLLTTIAPLNSDDLKELLNDDDKLDAKVDEVLLKMTQQKFDYFDENRRISEANIEKEPKIVELRGNVAELMEEGRTRCTSVQEKLSQLKDKNGGITQDTALALLQTAAAESEELTESFVKKFNENEVNVEAFLDEFLASRRTMHLRKLKVEKMQELIRKQSQRPAYGNSNFYPPASGVGGVPYPMMGPMMPMPPPQRPY